MSRFKRVIAGLVVLGVALVVSPAPASAHTALLGYCPTTTSFRLHLPATRVLPSTPNQPGGEDGFRSCDFASADSHVGPRTVINFRCWGGNGIDPIFNIGNDTLGQRAQHTVTCNNVWQQWPSNNGWPNGTNSDSYHVHLWTTNVYLYFDAYFDGAEIRVGT
jgi:hypothetical protein